MAIYEINELCLYSSDVMNPVECHAAKAWLDHSGISYKWLNYNDANQLPEVTKALNTWWSGKTLGEWPFVVYRYKSNENSVLFADFIEGLDNIKNQLSEIISSSEKPWV
jgi:hypothetical protein